jgi:hypothetical protein
MAGNKRQLDHLGGDELVPDFHLQTSACYRVFTGYITQSDPDIQGRGKGATGDFAHGFSIGQDPVMFPGNTASKKPKSD